MNASRDLLNRVTKFGIISQDDFEQVFSTLSHAPPPPRFAQDRSAAAAQVAEQLKSRGLLTPYQAKVVANDRLEDLVFDTYVVQEELGKGGMGCVYKAKDSLLKRDVAIKTIRANLIRDSEAVERFLREARVVVTITHPNVVAALHASRRGEEYYLVMEYIEGTTFYDLVRTLGPMSPPQIRHCINGAAKGLHHAHQKGIVHRDIKPDNLMLTKDNVVKVLDLGLARVSDMSSGGAHLTVKGTVMGTFDYMAPEQCEDSRKVDARTDIYSLGCTLYFLCVGRHIFGDKTENHQKMYAHVNVPSPSILAARPGIPPRLDAIYRKMTAKRSEDRFSSMNDVIYALSQDLNVAQVAVPKWPGADEEPPAVYAQRTPSPAPGHLPPPTPFPKPQANAPLELELDMPNTPPPLRASGPNAWSKPNSNPNLAAKSGSGVKKQAPAKSSLIAEEILDRHAHLNHERWIGASAGLMGALGIAWIGVVGSVALTEYRTSRNISETLATLLVFFMFSSLGLGMFITSIGVARGNFIARAFALAAWMLTILGSLLVLIFGLFFVDMPILSRITPIIVSSLIAVVAGGSVYLMFCEKGRCVFSKPYLKVRKQPSDIQVGGGLTMIASLLTFLAIFGVLLLPYS